MPGSSNWIILYDKTSGQVTRGVWDDETELTLQHPAATLGPNEASFLWPTTQFRASAINAGIYGYVIEIDPTLMQAVASHAQASANAVAYANATATANATQANINAQIAAAQTPPSTGGGSVGNAVP